MSSTPAIVGAHHGDVNCHPPTGIAAGSRGSRPGQRGILGAESTATANGRGKVGQPLTFLASHLVSRERGLVFHDPGDPFLASESGKPTHAKTSATALEITPPRPGVSNAAWTPASTPIAAGSDVQPRVQCSDGAGPGELVECGVDQVSICPQWRSRGPVGCRRPGRDPKGLRSARRLFSFPTRAPPDPRSRRRWCRRPDAPRRR